MFIVASDLVLAGFSIFRHEKNCANADRTRVIA
jgi:hypothetical protein